MPDTIPFAPIDPAAKLQTDVAAFLADARAKAADGKINVTEFGGLTVELLRLCVEGLDAIPSDKKAKQQWAIGIIGTLFDNVAGYAVPFALQPFWFIAKPLVRQLVLAAASGALEQILRLSREAAPSPAPEPAA